MTKAKKGNTIADLRAVHDKSVVIPNRIKAALNQLHASGDAWIYESDFMRLCKPPVSGQDIARFRDQFQDFWAEMPSVNGKNQVRRVWFATKSAADEWKESIGG